MSFQKLITPVVSGSLFGLGLALSGMTNTDKVQNFLDLFGNWDPQLMIVMGSALTTFAICYRLIIKREKPIQGEKFHIPTAKHIDKRLISGAALFGIGWGLVGYCPGPALASFAYGYWQPAVFIIAMLVGSRIAKKVVG